MAAHFASTIMVLKSLSLSVSLSLFLHIYNARYSPDKVFMSWQLLHGRSFVFARTDWEYVLNTFSFGYAIGYHFIASKEGSCNGNFLGIGKIKVVGYVCSSHMKEH